MYTEGEQSIYLYQYQNRDQIALCKYVIFIYLFCNCTLTDKIKDIWGEQNVEEVRNKLEFDERVKGWALGQMLWKETF